MTVRVATLRAADEAAAEALVTTALGGRLQARLGEVHDVVALPGAGAWEHDELIGVATYAAGADQVELAALAVTADRRRRGVGGLLVERVVEEARALSAERVWLVTTNDNLDAFRLYLRHGFRLEQVHLGGVDLARELKPSIPLIGEHGIPLHDEWVLVRHC